MAESRQAALAAGPLNPPPPAAAGAGRVDTAAVEAGRRGDLMGANGVLAKWVHRLVPTRGQTQAADFWMTKSS